MTPGLDYLRDRGVRATIEALLHPFIGGFSKTNLPEPLTSSETPEFDIAVVLHACRPDVFREVAEDYWFALPAETRLTNAPMTSDWVRETLAEMDADAGYISGLPMDSSLPTDAAFVEDLTGYDGINLIGGEENAARVHPESVTEHAVYAWRNRDVETLVVHYAQPHPPFKTAEFSHQRDAVYRVMRGEVSEDVFRESYRDNLRWVLDSVETLVQSVDAQDIVITGDHGYSIGERGVWGCVDDPGVKMLRTVPWTTISGEVVEEFDPTPSDGFE